MDLEQPVVRDALVLQPIGLQLQVIIVLAKDLAVFAGHPGRPGQIFLSDQIRHLTAQAAGEGDQPFMMFLQQLLVHPRLIIKTFKIRFTHKLDEILVPLEVLRQQDQVVVVVVSQTAVLGEPAARRHIGLTTDDGLDSRLLGLAVELDRPEHVAVIGHGHRRLAELLDLLHQRVNLVRAVEQAVLRVEMEMDELG